jgi:uncharacterized integral membrane protein
MLPVKKVQLNAIKLDLKNPWVVFCFSILLLSALFFFIPINLFEGEIIFQENGKTWTQRANISLSLVTKGYLLACFMIVGFPAILAYRTYLKITKSKGNHAK